MIAWHIHHSLSLNLLQVLLISHILKAKHCAESIKWPRPWPCPIMLQPPCVNQTQWGSQMLSTCARDSMLSEGKTSTKCAKHNFLITHRFHICHVCIVSALRCCLSVNCYWCYFVWKKTYAKILQSFVKKLDFHVLYCLLLPQPT